MEIKSTKSITPVNINSATIINGDLIFETDARIDGRILGSVTSLENKVVIGNEGSVIGKLIVQDLIVFGKVEGEVVVLGTTVINLGATISGSLNSRSVDVKDGAILDVKILTDVNQHTIEKSLEMVETVPENSSSFLRRGIQMMASHRSSVRVDERATG